MNGEQPIRAVPLATGRHELEFRFRSKPYVLGKRLSLSTIAGLVIMSTLLTIRRRRHP